MEARTRRIYKFRDPYTVWVTQLREAELTASLSKEEANHRSKILDSCASRYLKIVDEKRKEKKLKRKFFSRKKKKGIEA